MTQWLGLVKKMCIFGTEYHRVQFWMNPNFVLGHFRSVIHAAKISVNWLFSEFCHPKKSIFNWKGEREFRLLPKISRIIIQNTSNSKGPTTIVDILRIAFNLFVTPSCHKRQSLPITWYNVYIDKICLQTKNRSSITQFSKVIYLISSFSFSNLILPSVLSAVLRFGLHSNSLEKAIKGVPNR